MGGIIVGTLLTLLFLPALYVAWFRVVPTRRKIDGQKEEVGAANLTSSPNNLEIGPPLMPAVS